MMRGMDEDNKVYELEEVEDSMDFERVVEEEDEATELERF